jgi:hypothetical protein
MKLKRYIVKNRTGYSTNVILLTTDNEQEAIDFAAQHKNKAEVFDRRPMVKKSIYKNY